MPKPHKRDDWKPSVLLVASYSPFAVGGVGQFMIDLGTEWVRRGYDVGMLFRSEPKEADLPPRISGAFRQEIRYTSVSPWRTLHLLWRTARSLLALRRRFRVWHVVVPQPMTALAVVLAKIVGIPTVVTVFAAYPASGRFLADRLHRLSEAVVLRNATAVVYECEATRRKFTRREGRVVLNGIDVSFYRPNESRRDARRRKLGLRQDAVVILFLGRITVSKGARDLLEAYHRLVVGARWNTELLLVGPLEWSPPQAAIDSSVCGGSVRLVGPVGKDDVLDYYQAADVFVLPSYQEGISSSLVEAMACSLPAVVSDVGGNPEVVVHSESGFLFRPGDVELLRASLASLVEDGDRREVMGRRGRERIAAKFSLRAMADGYEAAYRDALRGGR